MSIDAPLQSCFPTKPLKFLAPMRGVKTDSVQATDEYIGLEQLDSWTGRLSDAPLEKQPEGSANIFQSGDVLFGKLRPYLAKGWVADRTGVCSTECLVLTPGEADPRFLRYCLLTSEVIAVIDGSTYGSKMPRADWSFIGSIKLPNPPSSEQERIANFLDEQTARIDALIAGKENLASKTNEYFLASLIKGVSTGGQTQNLIPSALPWVESIPCHWGTPKLGYLFQSIGSGTTPSTEDITAYGPGVPWVTTSELREEVINLTEKEISDSGLKAYSALKIHPAGSVAIAMYGATIGRLGILGVDATVNQACCVLSRPLGVLPKFVFYALWAMREHILVMASGGGQPNINQDKVRSFRIPLPPLSQQAEIVKKLDSLRQSNDVLKENILTHIERLREYRSSLISAAVTGQIDINNYQMEAA